MQYVLVGGGKMLKEVLLKYSTYIIAYLSIAGYYLAYEYKEGYYHYFNIPSVYINNLDLIDIINMVTAIIAFFSMVLYLILTHRPRDKKKEETVGSRVNQIILPLAILFLIAGYFDIWLIRSISLITILLMIIYNFVLPLVFNNKVKGYNNKIAAFFKSDNDMSLIEIVEFKIKHQFTSTLIVVIFLTYCLGHLINLLGYQNAMDEERFNIAEINEIKHIVFNIDSDKVIAAAINEHSLSNDFSVYYKTDITIKNEVIKDLKVD